MTQGAICLDILKDAWSPVGSSSDVHVTTILIYQVLTLKSTLISLQSLLSEPVPDDPQDAEGKLRDSMSRALLTRLVAKHFLTDRKSFESTAKHWAQAYAQAPANKVKRTEGKQMTDAEQAGLGESNVVQFAEMGFPRDKVVSVQKNHISYRMGTDDRLRF